MQPQLASFRPPVGHFPKERLHFTALTHVTPRSRIPPFALLSTHWCHLCHMSSGIPCSICKKFDVILLTKIRSATWDDSILPDHSVALLPASRDGQAGEGILIATRRNILYQVLDWASDDCTLWVKLIFQGNCRPLIIGCCYIPPAGSPQLHSLD